MTTRRATLLLLMLSLVLALLPALHALSAPAPQADSPAELFRSRLAALADLKNLHQHFTCRRDLAGIDTPLTSSGDFWIRPGNRKPNSAFISSGAGGALHIRTQNPYISETILEGGKFIGRTQHEVRWQISDQSPKPGLTSAMGQIAGWCIGDPGKLADWFTVELSAPVANQPETFTLSPRIPDLQKSIHSIALRFDPHTHYLTWARLSTAESDQSTYEFSDFQADTPFPSEVFRYDSR